MAAPEPVEICISVAARPGRFGLTVHNAGYRALGLDFVYKPCGAAAIEPVIAAVRTLGIRGCSVSMPFKEAVVALLDTVDGEARRTGAVNTVLNRDGRLIGYNTDIDGVRAALRALDLAGGRAVVLGAGGVARATVVALDQAGLRDVVVCGRTADRAAAVATLIGGATAPWDERERLESDVLINATSIGMAPDIDALPLDPSALSRHRAVIDLVASPPDTALIRAARAAGLPCVDGQTVALHQAARQFVIYTGRDAPIDAMRAAIAAAQEGR